ncbi:hypothetical protein C8R43DRAFT_942822 [Mycena crocata]|nr:hypothetical protein C8R43DRAFT_942822 [Mycena crocata]
MSLTTRNWQHPGDADSGTARKHSHVYGDLFLPTHEPRTDGANPKTTYARCFHSAAACSLEKHLLEPRVEDGGAFLSKMLSSWPTVAAENMMKDTLTHGEQMAAKNAPSEEALLKRGEKKRAAETQAGPARKQKKMSK